MSGFGSDNFLPRPIGVVSWCIIEMEGDTSKRLPILAVAEIPFDIRIDAQRNSAPHRDGQSMKIVDSGRRPNNGNQAF
jgi:hypothetical protein